MKFLIAPFFIVLFFNFRGKISKQYPISSRINEYDSFRLNYYSAGLGSGFGTMQPTFRATGTKYIFTYEQNSFIEGWRSEEIDTISIGNLRTSSIDSIIILIASINDSFIYESNAGIQSGSIEDIDIRFKHQHLRFQLHNASHPVAKQIVTILNSNIPFGEKKLNLFRYPGTTEQEESYYRLERQKKEAIKKKWQYRWSDFFKHL